MANQSDDTKKEKAERGKGRSFDSYLNSDVGSLEGLSDTVAGILSQIDQGFAVFEQRFPALFEQFDSLKNRLMVDEKQIESAMNVIEKLWTKHIKKVAEDQQKVMKQNQTMKHEIFNAILKHGKDARKMRASLDSEELKSWEEMNKRRLNDYKKMVPKLGKMMKSMIFDLTTDELKKAMSAPFEGMKREYNRFKKTIAGRAVFGLFGGADKETQRKNRQQASKFAGDIYGIAFAAIKKLANGIRQVFQFNVFNFLRDKFQELKSLIDGIPGSVAAQAAFQNMQQTAASLRRDFGATAELSAQYTNSVYAASNATIRVADNTRALLAVQSAGVRGQERSVELMGQVAVLSKAHGLSEQAVTDQLVFNNMVLGMSAEHSFVMVEAADVFADRMAQTEDRAVSTAQVFDALARNSENMRQLTNLGADPQELQSMAMVTSQLEQIANISEGTLTDWYMQLGGTDSGLLGMMLGDPTRVQQLMNTAGGGVELLSMLAEQWTAVRGTSQQRVFEEALEGMNLGFTVNELNALTEVIDKTPEYYNAATESVLDFDDAFSRSNTQAAAAQTPLQLLEGQIESLGNSIDVGGIKLGELGEVSTILNERFGVLGQGFSTINSAADSAFGPLSGIVKMLAGVPLSLAMIGGMTGDFSEEMESIGLGGLFGFARDSADIFRERILPVLNNVWRGIQGYFTDASHGPDGDKTLFGLMLQSGVDWVISHGPTIISQVSEVVSSLIDAMGTAFESIEDSNLGTMFAKLFGKALTAALPIIRSSTNLIISVVGAMIDTMKEVLTDAELQSSISGFVTELFTFFTDSMGQAGDLISSAFDTFAEYAFPFFVEVGSAIAEGVLQTIISVLPEDNALRRSVEGRTVGRGGVLGEVLSTYFTGTSHLSTGNRSDVIANQGDIRISDRPGSSRDGGAREHAGFDLVVGGGSADSMGQQVTPFDAGTVMFSGQSGGYGNLVVVEHPIDPNVFEGYDKMTVLYAHLNEISPRIGEGSPVDIDTILGTVGGSGASGPAAYDAHLHVEGHLGGAVMRESGRFGGSGAIESGGRIALSSVYSDMFEQFEENTWRYTHGGVSQEEAASSAAALPGITKGLGDSAMMMAKGGLVDQATLAVIGEAGPEVVYPLEDFEKSQRAKDQKMIEKLEEMNIRLMDKLDELIGAVEDEGVLSKAM